VHFVQSLCDLALRIAIFGSTHTYFRFPKNKDLLLSAKSCGPLQNFIVFFKSLSIISLSTKTLLWKRLVTPAVIAFYQAISSPISEGECYDLKSAPTVNNKKTNLSSETEQQN